MRRRHHASPLIGAALVALVAGGLTGSASPATARDLDPGQRTLRSESPLAGPTDGIRTSRRVSVGDLPPSRGLASPWEPGLLTAGPALGSLRAPGTTTADPPSETIPTGHPPANEPTAFPGLFDDTGFEPPDPFIAVGPEHVIQAVNTAFRISDRDGTELVTVDMFDFFGLNEFYAPGEVAYFDPRVIYDSLHGRWIAIEASFDCFAGPDWDGFGYIDIALSDSADAMGDWQLFSLPYGDLLPDYPGIGTSTDKVVLSSNLFELVPGGTMGCVPTSPLLGTDLEVMAWSELLGTGSIDLDSFYSDSFAGGTYPHNFFTWRPALQTPATSATVFVVAERFDEGVAYARITGTPAGAATSSMTISDLTAADVIEPFAQPSQPEQPGSPATIADALDGRPTDAVWQNDRLVFVSTYPCDPAAGALEDRDCVRVSELSTAVPSAPTLTQDLLIAEDGADHYMGGVGFAGNGDLHVVWTRSSATAGQYPSSYTAYQLVGDAPGELTTPALLAAGTGTYPGDRWGDYVGVAQDPQVPNAVWQGNQYSAGADHWATHVSQLQTGGNSYVPITPLRVLDSRFGIGLSGVFSANVPRTWQVAGVGAIPADAIAVTGNFVTVGQTAAGYAAVTPTPNANPPTSSLNFPLGDVRANNTTITLSPTGSLSAVYKAAAGRTTHFVFDVTGYFVAGDDAATYHPLTPVRVLDSRFNTGLGGAFTANVPRTLSIAGANGIPADAVAVTANLAVVGQNRAGYMAITPDPDPNPPTATMNFPLGDIRANGLTAPLNASGDLSLVYKASAGATTHFVLDITGYYLDAPDGLLFYPLNPGRIMDTRAGVVLTGLTGVFGANVPRTLDVAGHYGVPLDGVGAITANLSIVHQTAAGYGVITPDPNANPPTATINFPLGDVRGNGVTVPLNGAGDLSFVYKAPGGRTTHVILDVTGYFAD